MPEHEPGTPVQGQRASCDLPRRGQLTAAQAAAAAETPSHDAEGDQASDDDREAATEADQGRVERIAEDTVAQRDNGLELDRAADGVHIHRSVQVADLLGLVGIEARGQQELAKCVDAHDVPVMGACLARCPPDRSDQCRDQGDDDGALDDLAPGTHAAGGDPDPAPCVPADPGH